LLLHCQTGITGRHSAQENEFGFQTWLDAALLARRSAKGAQSFHKAILGVNSSP
jgi:hypothetical protein